MPTKIPEYFFVVTLEARPDGVSLRWEDDSGRKGVADLQQSESLWAAIGGRTGALRGLQRPSGNTASVPIFVEGDPESITALRNRCPTPLLNEVSFVHLMKKQAPYSRSDAVPVRAAVELPLHLFVVDNAWPQGPWPKLEGLAVEGGTHEDAQTVMENRQVDVLFVDLEPNVDALSTFAPYFPGGFDWGRINHPPRLVVTRNRSWIWNTPVGACLVPAGWPDDFFGLVLNLVHDDPIHDATRAIEGSELWTTPASNQDLRLSSAADSIVERALALMIEAPSIVLGGPFKSGVLVQSHRFVGSLFDSAREDLAAVGTILTDPVSFDRETSGLAPLHRSTVAIEAASRAVAELNDELANLHPEATDTFARFVDVRFMRLVQSRLLLPDGRPDTSLLVPPNVALKVATRYELRVQIGAQVDGSLVVGHVVSIDDTMPRQQDGESRELEVAVFEQGLTVEGDHVQRLVVPSGGSTEPLRFTLCTGELGTAGARISFYWKKELLQSYQVVATVAEEERFLRSDEPRIQAVLDFSRTRAFLELSDHAQPAIALGLNTDVSGGTHSLFVKGDGTPIAFRLPERDLENAMANFRQILLEATEDKPGTQRHSLQFPNGNQCREDLWKLATAGRNLWTKLRTDHFEELWDIFDQIQDSPGLQLQITRLNAAFTFPWATIYDWKLPDACPPEVCLGTTSQGGPCQHHPTSASSDALCARGFWGIRHRLEQLVGKSTPIQRLHGGPVVLAVDPSTNDVREIIAACGPGVAAVVDATEPALLPLLFREAGRPAVYVALGDHITESSPAGPKAPYIRVDERVIEKQGLLEEAIASPRWRTERPLVMLMSCKSGVPGELVADWVQPLLAKGAAGVIATEALVYPDLAVETTRFLLACLYDKTQHGGPCDLAEAMRRLNLHLLEQSIPLGFVFSALADAGLRLL